MPIIFRTFVPVPESTINTIYSPSKTHKSYEQEMENDSSSDKLHHHPPAGRCGRERRDVEVDEVKSNEVNEKGRFQNLSVRLCRAAHREQYRPRRLPGRPHRRRGRRTPGLRGPGLPARRQHLRTRLLCETHNKENQ